LLALRSWLGKACYRHRELQKAARECFFSIAIANCSKQPAKSFFFFQFRGDGSLLQLSRKATACRTSLCASSSSRTA
jgi:hypothetical protein